MCSFSTAAPAVENANAASESQLVPGARRMSTFGVAMRKNPCGGRFILDQLMSHCHTCFNVSGVAKLESLVDSPAFEAGVALSQTPTAG